LVKESRSNTLERRRRPIAGRGAGDAATRAIDRAWACDRSSDRSIAREIDVDVDGHAHRSSAGA